MISRAGIQVRFDEIIDILVEKFNAEWIRGIELEMHDEGHTYVHKYGLTVYLSLEKLQISIDDGAFKEYGIVLSHINVAYHVLPDQGRYIITNDPLSWIFLHELSHILAYQADGDVADHGKEFCEVYDTLIYHVQPSHVWPFRDQSL